MSNFRDNPYRELVYGVDIKVPLIDKSYCIGINFDNAATTPPLKSVIDEVINFSPYYSSIHRGDGYKSQLSTYMYETSREIVKFFINDYSDMMDVIYVKNCTEAINKLAGILASQDKESIILSTSMEHHSNDLPWRKNFEVKYVEVDDEGYLDMDDFKSKLELYNGRISLVAITGASNVTGIKNPIYTIANLAHSYGAKILVDGAQLIPHSKVIWTASPDKEESGSPNLIGSITLGAAINELSKIGMSNIDEYEKYLTVYTTKHLQSIHSVKIYSNYSDFQNKVSIIPFNIEGIHHTIVAKILSYEFGIAVRSGCFCAHPYLQRLLKIPKSMIEEMTLASKDIQPGMVRISFGIYNTIDEIDKFLYAIKKIVDNKGYYTKKYTSMRGSFI